MSVMPSYIRICFRLLIRGGCFIGGMIRCAMIDRIEWGRLPTPAVEQIYPGDENRYENQKPFKTVHFTPLTFLRHPLFVPSGSIRLPYGQRANRFLPICEAAGRELDWFVQRFLWVSRGPLLRRLRAKIQKRCSTFSPAISIFISLSKPPSGLKDAVVSDTFLSSGSIRHCTRCGLPTSFVSPS